MPGQGCVCVCVCVVCVRARERVSGGCGEEKVKVHFKGNMEKTANSGQIKA